MNARMLFLYAETPVHAGGPESVGAIDLPIQRNVTTDAPVIWGQSLKGAFKSGARAAGWNDTELSGVFGGDPPVPGVTPANDTTAGWCTVVEARVAAFPVPCPTTTMRWVTSAAMLEGVARLARVAGYRDLPAVPDVNGDYVAVPAGSGLPPDGPVADYRVTRHSTSGATEAEAWATWLAERALLNGDGFERVRDRFRRELTVVPDALATELMRAYSHVAVRNVLDTDGSKRVKNLFTEECLPSETVLVSLLVGNGAHSDKLDELLNDRIVNVGGSESIGKGLMWTRVDQNGASGANGGDR